MPTTTTITDPHELLIAAVEHAMTSIEPRAGVDLLRWVMDGQAVLLEAESAVDLVDLFLFARIHSADRSLVAAA